MVPFVLCPIFRCAQIDAGLKPAAIFLPIGTRRLFCYDSVMPVYFNDNPKTPAHREGA